MLLKAVEINVVCSSVNGQNTRNSGSHGLIKKCIVKI